MMMVLRIKLNIMKSLPSLFAAMYSLATKRKRPRFQHKIKEITRRSSRCCFRGLCTRVGMAEVFIYVFLGLITSYIHATLILLNAQRANEVDQAPMPDLLFDVFQTFFVSSYSVFCQKQDYFLYPFFGLAVGMALLKRSGPTLRFCLVSFINLNIFRGVLNILTTFPETNPDNCLRLPEEMFVWGAGFMDPSLKRNGRVEFNPLTTTSCGNVGLSGHSIILTTGALAWMRLCQPTHASSRRYDDTRVLFWLRPIAIWTFVTLFALYIIACRFHYTIDVVLAIIIWIALDFAGFFDFQAKSIHSCAAKLSSSCQSPFRLCCCCKKAKHSDADPNDYI